MTGRSGDEGLECWREGHRRHPPFGMERGGVRAVGLWPQPHSRRRPGYLLSEEQSTPGQALAQRRGVWTLGSPCTSDGVLTAVPSPATDVVAKVVFNAAYISWTPGVSCGRVWASQRLGAGGAPPARGMRPLSRPPPPPGNTNV